jgi:hypothetical protein
MTTDTDTTTPAQPISPPDDTTTDAKPTRGELDPIETPLWRLKRPARKDIMRPFVGHRVVLERWFGRVAAMGDQQYVGELVAVATTTTGSNSDLLILHTDNGTTWALSTAQIARVQLAYPLPVAAEPKPEPEPQAPKRRGGRPRKATPVKVEEAVA